MNLVALRHTAKEILAIATLELFPSVQLVGGGVDEIGFHYFFHFPKEILTLFSAKELHHIEDRMIALIQENRPIKVLEMMRENAAHFLEHLKQPLRAQEALEDPSNIVTLIEVGSFRDLCKGPFLTQTSDLKAFKLQGFEMEGGRIKIYGTAFFQRDELKKFLKKYKEAAASDPQLLGPKEGYFLPYNEEWIYLERGEELIGKLTLLWEKEHEDFERVFFPDTLESSHVHLHILKEKKWKKIASLSPYRGDFVSICYEDEQELFEILISSLHFIEKAFKIFAFESRVYCLEPKRGWLAGILKQRGVLFEHELTTAGEGYISFRVVDGYGRERALSCIEVERKKRVVHRSLFHPMKGWVAHMIENGVKR